MNAESTRVAVLANAPTGRPLRRSVNCMLAGKVFDAVAVLHAQRVIARTSEAAEQGVHWWACASAKPKQRARDMHIAAHNPERDRLMFEPVVHAIAELVPLVEVSMPGIVVLATRGPSRYVGGDDSTCATAALLWCRNCITQVGMGNAGVAFHLAWVSPMAGLTAHDRKRASAASVRAPRVVAPLKARSVVAVLPVVCACRLCRNRSQCGFACYNA
jgi:hypothetical protein